MKKCLRWIVSTVLFVCLVLSNANADPVSSVSGSDVNIDATKGISLCSGTGDIRIATDCTGGGTQSSWVFNNSTGVFTGAFGATAAFSPSVDNTYDLGSILFSWRSIYADTQINTPAIDSSSALTLYTSDNGNRKWVFSDSSDTALFLTMGNNTTGQTFKFLTGTTDTTDTAFIRIGHGAAGGGSNRGAYLLLSGNEASGTPADLQLSAGTATGGQIDLYGTSSNTLGWSLDESNNWLSDATTGGGLILSGTGDTISVQEATAASACMGVATPNGTTNVTVTTSCAVTGARVFFSRAGAITDMGTITVTTAPNNTNFTFASTGASDTLASSVVYLIVKEAA